MCDYSPRSNVLAVSVSWLASVLWQLGAIREKDRLFVLTLRSNYLFSWERFWGRNGSPVCSCPLHLDDGFLLLFLCSQVPQEPGHLPGVQGQHKDQLCHQLSGDQRGDLSLQLETLTLSSTLTFMVLLDMITKAVHLVFWPGLLLCITHWSHANATHSVCICSGETLCRVFNV